MTTPSIAQISPRYDLLTRTLHWIFAIGILYATAVGYGLHIMPAGPLHDFLSRLNMSLATVLILLYPVRSGWRLLRTNPAPPQGLSPQEYRPARLVQTLLYSIILAVLVSGYLMVPDGYHLFGLLPIPTPFAKGPATEAFFLLHRISCATLAALIGLHLLGVLVHTVLRPIGLLKRML